MSSFHETIIEYFANRALRAFPDRAHREKSAHALQENYAVLKHHSDKRTLTEAERAIYGVTRLAGTLCVMRNVLQLFMQKQDWLPKNILDCGTGPATALFAAYEMFGKDAQYTGIEKDAGFIATATQAIRDNIPEASTQFRFVQGVLPHVAVDEKFDLTLFSYVLSETPPDQIEAIVRYALERTNNYLIITDAGTPQVYRHMMAVRRFIIEQGFTILAPCPHQRACPLAAPDFCHFPARFARHSEARRLKHASAQTEDEKYCYLIAVSNRVAPHNSSSHRIIKRPMKRPGHCILDVCTEAGLKRITVSKKHKGLYAVARKASWGDAIFVDPNM